MSIYTQDNKILTDNSGDMLKIPPIIDISSDYGVIKDVNNKVLSVKNRYQPNQFLSVAGKEPIENGNGFEFGVSQYLKLSDAEKLSQNDDWVVEFELKLNNYDSRNRILIENNNILSQLYINEYDVGLYTNAVVKIGELPTDIYNNFYAIKLTRRGSTVECYVNNSLTFSTNDTHLNLLIGGYVTFIGNSSRGLSSQELDGNLKYLKIYKS